MLIKGLYWMEVYTEGRPMLRGGLWSWPEECTAVSVLIWLPYSVLLCRNVIYHGDQPDSLNARETLLRLGHVLCCRLPGARLSSSTFSFGSPAPLFRLEGHGIYILLSSGSFDRWCQGRKDIIFSLKLTCILRSRSNSILQKHHSSLLWVTAVLHQQRHRAGPATVPSHAQRSIHKDPLSGSASLATPAGNYHRFPLYVAFSDILNIHDGDAFWWGHEFWGPISQQSLPRLSSGGLYQTGTAN